MEKILIDTDVIIDFLRGFDQRIKTIFSKIEAKEVKAFISPISIVEVYTGEDMENDKKETILLDLLSFFEIIPLDQRLCKEAGKIKRIYKLGLADSIIAASCKRFTSNLFTFNIKHFKNIPNLLLYSLK